MSSYSNRENLKPPDSAHDAQQSRTAFPLLFLAGFIVLVALSLSVLFILPIHEDPTQEPSNQPAPSTRPEPHDSSKRSAVVENDVTPVTDNNQINATAALESLLLIKIEAERENITLWANNAYQDIIALETRGDQLFAAEHYGEAEDSYRQAAADLETVRNSRDKLFQQFLDEGYQYLSAEDGEQAFSSFNLALAINPDNGQAREGAKRAENLPQLLDLYRQADAYEQSGKLLEARNILEKLLQIDSRYQPALVSLERINTTIQEQEFSTGMSSFFTSLEAGELKHARSVLEELKKDQDGSMEISQAERLLIAEEESARVDNLSKRATVQCENEQWSQALSTYKQILSIAPNALRGLQGRDQAAKREALDGALNDHLAGPQRLQDAKQREAARQLLAHAQQFSPRGPRLTGQINQLDRLITLASAVVPVVITSDNMTDVAIYHVGKMGAFFSKDISLTPGSYTVVGSRNGFHDVRKVIEVDPENESNQFFIQCREQI